MAITQSKRAYDCPGCSGSVAFDGQSWQCETCGYAPNHSAD